MIAGECLEKMAIKLVWATTLSRAATSSLATSSTPTTYTNTRPRRSGSVRGGCRCVADAAVAAKTPVGVHHVSISDAFVVLASVARRVQRMRGGGVVLGGSDDAHRNVQAVGHWTLRTGLWSVTIQTTRRAVRTFVRSLGPVRAPETLDTSIHSMRSTLRRCHQLHSGPRPLT